MTTQVQNNATEINTNASTEVENSAPAAVTTPVKAKKQVKREDLTQEMLKTRYTLDETTGHFFFKEDGKTNLAGDFAGSIRAHDGYYSITVLGTMYSAKMLAEFFKNGVWPEAHANRKAAQPKLDADGNPIAKEVKAPRTTPRTPPVFTPEQIAAAKAAREAKAKEKAEAKTKVEANPKPSADEPLQEVNKQEDNQSMVTEEPKLDTDYSDF